MPKFKLNPAYTPTADQPKAIEGLAEDLGDEGYDWVLLDCPPSLGVLTVAALTAADGVLIPLQCETLSHRGVGQLLDTVHDVRRFTNRKLEVWGVLPTLYDGRTNHARTVLETISETYDLEVVEKAWEVLKAFASFGFCKAHAAAFAVPTYGFMAAIVGMTLFGRAAPAADPARLRAARGPRPQRGARAESCPVAGHERELEPYSSIPCDRQRRPRLPGPSLQHR